MKTTFNIPAHLPKRLTIAYPFLALLDTGSSVYHDLDRVVKEHKERGFNCLRLESGAGLTHDIHGNPRGPIHLNIPFGKYTTSRQIRCVNEAGYCDVLSRLLALCEACKKYDVYLILSSWYFLHTYWYLDTSLNEELLSLDAEDLFMTFAKYLHYILSEIEAHGFADRIAMAEIFNEVGSVPLFMGELKQEEVRPIDFSKKHGEALSWLRRQHPDLLFAYDNDCMTDEAIAAIPDTLQAFNGHNYFLWGVYGGSLEIGEPLRDDFFLGKYTYEDVAASRKDYIPLSPTCAPWYTRIARCNDLDPAKIPALEAYLTKRLTTHRQEYLDKLDAFCEGFKKVMERFPEIPIVSGEGVTYCSSQILHWEEKSEEYWDLVKIMILKYKEIGLWGTLIKTCCSYEDPSWELCKDKLKELNALFLE